MNFVSKILKKYGLPIAMVIGVLGYKILEHIDFFTPYLIFLMLTVSYSKISVKTLNFSPLHLWLIAFQIVGSWSVYFLLLPYDKVVAQGAFICVLAPTATAAAVITGMLGGSVSVLATYCLTSSFVIAFTAPFFFSFMTTHSDMTIMASVLYICTKVVPLLIFPFLFSVFIEKKIPRLHLYLERKQSISYYLWMVALAIVFARTTSFLLQQNKSSYREDIMLAVVSGIICVSQFVLGRYIGRKYGETIAGGQGLGQKNTILAIWMAQTYLNPLSSIAPAAYVLWQNIINSWQLWRARNTSL